VLGIGSQVYIFAVGYFSLSRGDPCPFTSHLVGHCQCPVQGTVLMVVHVPTVGRTLGCSVSITTCESYFTARPFSSLPERTKFFSAYRNTRGPEAARPGHSTPAFEMLDLVIYL